MLELLRIVAGYGQTTVLRDVTLRVPTGSVVALLGPNGAGKSTLLRVAAGHLRPFSGDIRMDGTSLLSYTPHRFARAGVCYVPEGRGIFRSLTVRENLILQSDGRDTKRALDRAVEAFPSLADRLDQTAGTLSGGEQQMLALAKSHVADAKYVFLDEVSLGLAPKVVDEMYRFIRELATRGLALLLVEQYVGRALELADFVYMLNRGRLEFVGEPVELDEEDVFRNYVGEVPG